MAALFSNPRLSISRLVPFRVGVLALLATTLFAGPFASPATASDIDLGPVETVDDVLASPEYLEEHADIARLYQAFFDRVPDADGLVYWIDVYEDGTGLIDLAGYFATSAEFQLTYGGELTDAEFLEVVYTNVLGRDYDQAGFDYWLGEIANGLRRHETVFWIVGGAEFKINFPFAGTFPAVESALLGSADLPSDYTESDQWRSNFTEAELLAADRCIRYRILNTNSFESSHGRADFSEFVHQSIYAFSDEARARNAVENQRRLVAECPFQQVTYDNGAVLSKRYTIFSAPELTDGLGDESLVISAEWRWQNGPVYNFYLYVVRDANVVTITDLTNRNARADFATGGDYAVVTSERVRALLGLDS